MHRIRRVVLCGLALLALGAVTASAASAAPEFRNEKGEVPVKKGITTETKSGTPAPVLSGGGVKILCSTESSTGKIATATTINKTVVTYKGCKAETTSAKSCGEAKTKGGTEKEVVKTKALKGSLGESAQSATGIAQRLEPESGEVFSEIEFEKSCNFLTSTKVEGRVVGEVAPIKTLSLTGELIFAESGGKQAITTFNGESGNTLKAFGFLESTLVSAETVKFEEKVEVT